MKSSTQLVCPVCDHIVLWYSSSEGGAAMNIECAHCQTKFWYGLGFGMKIIELSDVSKEAGFSVGQELREEYLPCSDEEFETLDQNPIPASTRRVRKKFLGLF